MNKHFCICINILLFWRLEINLPKMFQEYINILFKKMKINITDSSYVSRLKLTSTHISKHILRNYFYS